MADDALLESTLALAVPMWIEELRNAPLDEVLARGQVCAQVIAHKGDIILYKSKKPGETAEAFNRLAEGIACLAYMPGGVTLFGQHWEARQKT